MALDDREIARLLADPSKRILGPLRWTDDEDLSCGLEFAAELRAASGESLLVRGQRCDPAGSLRFALILRGVLPEGPRDPVDRAWQLFCRLTRIAHDGLLADPPPRQEILL